MPPLNTTPGACPAQVLMPTTSVRGSLPPDARLVAVTPVEPIPRSGSGGAFLSASKSFTPGFSAVCAAGLSPTAHWRRSAPR